MTKTDLIIIGAGPGGYRSAEHAAKHGLSVTVFEDKYAGGTCLNCGCIPTKAFCRNAEIIDSLREGEEYGLNDLSYKIDFQKIAERKQHVVETLRSGVETLMKMPGITYVEGHAELKDARTVVCNGNEYEAENIIIATGSSAKMIPIPGIEQKNVVTSTELLDVKEVPERLCIVGAGVIGMEFASAFSSFGSKVTVVEFLKECLPTLDSDIAKRLRQQISKRGVEFYMQAGVKAISGNTVTFERKGKEQTVEADLILIATGRQPNVEGIGLERAGIDFSKRGIQVDDNFQTNVPGIYAIGDVNAKCMLAHAAEFQGFHVVNHILGKPGNIRHEVMPSAIFTHPEAASVGMTEDQCKEQGIAAVCKKAFFRANGKALAMNETEGLLKLIAREDGRILGCHAYGAHAADLVQEVSVLMCRDTTVDELKDMVHIHPTLSEIVHDAAMNF